MSALANEAFDWLQMSMVFSDSLLRVLCEQTDPFVMCVSLLWFVSIQLPSLT